jgi:hypothetical protein
MKAFGDERIADGENCLVVDLGGCTGMDSTFMGTLAGMAARLSANEGGVLQIADSGPRNRRSLEDLGLDFLLEIDPPSASWRGNVDGIRGNLRPPAVNGLSGQLQRTAHVLEAHQILSETNDKNAREFSNVVKLLENELAEKLKTGEKPKEN